MSFNIFKNIVDDCSSLNVAQITLLGKGEPFLHPHIYDMIEYVKAKKIKLSFCTNGSFDIKEIRLLSKVDDFNINLSSAREKTFRNLQYNDRNVFDDIHNKIKVLSGIKRIQGFPKIRVVYLINALNFLEIEDMLKIGRDYALDYIEFRLMFATSDTESLILDRNKAIKLHSNLKKIINQNDPFLKRSNLLYLYGIISRMKSGKDDAFRDSSGRDNNLTYYRKIFNNQFKCCAGWFYVAIDIDGNVYSCCHYVDILTAGNIYKNSFKEIWRSKKFSAVRKKMKYSMSIKDELWQKCHNCTRYAFLEGMFKKAKNMPKAIIQ